MAGQGRKDPGLLRAQPVGGATPPEEIELGLEDDDTDEASGMQLVYDGDVIGASATLAVLFEGDRKESYFNYNYKTRVQPNESASDAYARVTTVTVEGVIGIVDEAGNRIAEYAAEREERLNQATQA